VLLWEDDNVIADQIVLNTASVAWSSQAGDQTATTSPYTNLGVERTGDSGGIGGAANSYTDGDTATTNLLLAGGGISTAKTAVDSTDPLTTITPLEVAIGEIVTYQLLVSVPTSTVVEDFAVEDTLPSGMELYYDAAAGYNTSGGWFDVSVSSSSLVSTVGFTNPNVSTTSNSFALNYYTSGPGSGSTVRNISTTSAETITVLYKATVRDVAGNDGEAGSQTTLSNTAFAGWLAPTPDDPNTGPDESDPASRASTTPAVVTATVVEPELQITKTVSTAPTLNDRSISYQFNICHTSDSTADAHQIVILDDTTNLNFNPASINVSGTGMAPTSYSTSSSSGSQIQINFDRIPLGFDCGANEIVVTFDAELSSSISTDVNFVNTVDIDYTSLSSTTDFAGEERSYSDSDTSTGTFTFDLSFTKSVIGNGTEASTPSGSVVVGEVVTYEINIPVPGVTFFDNFELTDTLDTGMAFVGFTSISASAASLTSNDSATTTNTVIDLSDVVSLNASAASTTDTSVVVGAGGTDFTIDFDRLQNTASGIESLTLRYEAVVLNSAANVSGAGLNNTAEITWTDGGAQAEQATTTPQIVQEPALDIVKNIITATSGEPVSGERTVTYELVVTHVGDSVTAHDLVITEDLTSIIDPNGAPPVGATGFMDFYFDYVTGSLIATTTSGATTQVSLVESVDGFEIGFDELPFGESLTLTFTMQVEAPPQTPEGSALDNLVDLSWSSLTGELVDVSSYSTADDVFVERSGNSSATPLNTYSTSSATSTTISYVDLELTQSVSEDVVSINEETTLTIDVSNVGVNPATGVIVLPNVPAGLGIVSATSTIGVYDIGTGLWTVGDLGVSATGTLIIIVTPLVRDTFLPRASIESADQPDIDSIPGNTNDSEDDEQTVEITVPANGGGTRVNRSAGCKDTEAINYDSSASIHESEKCQYEDVVDTELTNSLPESPSSSLLNQLKLNLLKTQLAKALVQFAGLGVIGDSGLQSGFGGYGTGKGTTGYVEEIDQETTDATDTTKEDSSITVQPSSFQREELEDRYQDTQVVDLNDEGVNESDDGLQAPIIQPEEVTFWRWLKDVVVFWR